MNNKLNQAFEHWTTQLEQNETRGMVLVYENDDFIQYFEKLDSCDNNNSLRTSDIDKNSLESSIKFNQLLGLEFHRIIFDAREQFDSNLFAALSGTLVAGGIILLRLPPKLNEIIHSAITDTLNFSGTINTPKDLSISPILLRLIRYALKSSCLFIVYQQEFQHKKIKPRLGLQHVSPLEDQSILVDEICRVSTGHAKRPLVITAHRGRGKSAALGLAANKLASSATVNIVVTAPNLSNLNSFYKHLELSLAPNKSISLDNGSCINFFPVDIIIQNKPKANLLIIDEAAAIPVQQLDALIKQYNRIVFATTIHGYEGNGQGFNIRFKKRLIQRMPQTKFRQLKAPMRWSNQDELESVCFKTFLLDADLSEAKAPSKSPSYKFVMLNKNILIENELMLRQVFALLVNAHYQTRPADLAQILSNPNLSVYALTESDQILAVALINKEGSLSKDLCNKIWSGQQRLKGELLPQSIIINHGVKTLGEMSFYRVMRIAVHPDLQGYGLGSQLLNDLSAKAEENQIDILGASFSANSQVVKFWLNNGYKIIRFGSAKDSSSGAFTCEVLKPLSDQSKQNTRTLTSQLNESLIYKLSGELKELDSQIVINLLRNQFNNVHVKLTLAERKEIEAFINNVRSYSAVDWALVKLLLIHLSSETSKHPSNDKGLELLVDRLLKQLPHSQLVEKYGLTGKKEIIAKVKASSHQLITNTQI